MHSALDNAFLELASIHMTLRVNSAQGVETSPATAKELAERLDSAAQTIKSTIDRALLVLENGPDVGAPRRN
jgi:hypothetical protein